MRFIDTELEFPVRHSYGGNSSCMEIIGGDHYTVCDMGSGLRCFGQQIMRKHGPAQPQIYNFFMSHVHWDHIMGFPFFPPAYIPGNTIRIHGGHAPPCSKKRFAASNPDPCFPVQWDQLRRNHRVYPSGHRTLVRNRRLARQGEVAAASGGFLRLPF